ncbi:ABC transporter substrate-binding protein [Candidatus Poriferisocius sp.]|uniref:ABC transporter substrate-binding protein n=1 Tax=Candidatus Poriferisocius sp. TaxID=3101276 RepID=UPI003B5C4086
MILLSLVAAACGDDDDSNASSSGAGASEPADDTAAPEPEDEASGDEGDAEDATTGSDSAAGDDCGAVSTGVTDTSVKVGSTAPLSGNAAAVGVTQLAQEAYYDYLNDEFGGVTMADGVTRTIDFIGLDDAAEAANALTNARRLVEQDEVFIVAGAVGTAANLSIREFLNEECVPQLFSGSGASTFGADYEEFPWTVAFNPTHISEAGTFVQYLKDTNPDAKAALLYVNIDAGTDFLEGFETAIEGTGIELVASEVFENTEPSVDAQVSRLASSGADTFMIVTTASHASQAIRRSAELGWELEAQYLTFVSNGVGSVLEPAGLENAQGLVSASYLKDASDPTWEGDAGMELYQAVMNDAGIDPNDGFAVWGFAQAQATVSVLENSEPTRSSVLDAALGLDGVQLDTVLPGITLNTTRTDHFPIEELKLIQFEGESWQLLE